MRLVLTGNLVGLTPTYQVDPQTGNPVVDTQGNPMFTLDNTLTGNTRTLAQAHSPGASADSQVVISDSLNPLASMTIANACSCPARFC